MGQHGRRLEASKLITLIDTKNDTVIYTAPVGGTWEAATIIRVNNLNRKEGWKRYAYRYADGAKQSNGGRDD